MAEILQAKKDGFHLDIEGFWLSDKFRISWQFLGQKAAAPSSTNLSG
jgi:predicted 3-demethylubiquinone-9 3-methyltransferase (glyoxalase superfamily)